MNSGVFALGALLLLATGGMAVAEPTAPTPAMEGALRRCMAIQPSEQRLRCFDSTSADILKSIASRDVVVLDRATVQRTRRGLFGFALPKIDIFGDRGKNADRDEVKQLQSHAVSVRSLGFGLWQITLDEGGVWQTTDPTDMHDPAAGSVILVKQAALGSYKITIDGRQPPVHAHRVN